MDRAINIALQLKVASGSAASHKPVVAISANTSTVDLIDDLEPIDDDHDPTTRTRKSSAIHIKVTRDAADDLKKDASDAGRACASIPAVNSCVVGGSAKAEGRSAGESTRPSNVDSVRPMLHNDSYAAGSAASVTGKKKKDFKNS